MPTDVNTDNVDLLSLSGHKIYGPKGVGALYVRRRRPRVRSSPIQDGGGQERGFRSGTLNVPASSGSARPANSASRRWSSERERLLGLRKKLENDHRAAKLDTSRSTGTPTSDCRTSPTSASASSRARA
jgi:cysteine desulfurase